MSSARAYIPIDTAPLRRALELLIAVAFRVLERPLDDKVLSGLIRHTRLIARMIREIQLCEIMNMRQRALARLKTDSAWKAQLRLQLGGYWVIRRWEERMKRQAIRAQNGWDAQNSSLRRREMAKARSSKAQAAHPRKGVKTDSAGLFRLAPIPRRPIPSAPNRCAFNEERPADAAQHSGALRERGFAPYPLQPQQIAIPNMKPIDDWGYDRKLRRYVIAPPLFTAGGADAAELPP